MGVEIEVSAFIDFLINYNNIDKVMWEPFIEPSCFQLNILRKCADHALDVSPSVVVSLNSSKQLNVNISEPLIECVKIRDKGDDDETDSVLGLGFLLVESSSMEASAGSGRPTYTRLHEGIVVLLLSTHSCCSGGNPKIWSSRSDDGGTAVSFLSWEHCLWSNAGGQRLEMERLRLARSFGGDIKSCLTDRCYAVSCLFGKCYARQIFQRLQAVSAGGTWRHGAVVYRR